VAAGCDIVAAAAVVIAVVIVNDGSGRVLHVYFPALDKHIPLIPFFRQHL